MVPGMRNFRMPINEFSGMTMSRNGQRTTFPTRGPGSKVVARPKKNQVSKVSSLFSYLFIFLPPCFCLLFILFNLNCFKDIFDGIIFVCLDS